MKCPVHNTAFQSPEVNNKIKLIGLMAVCMKHIICDTLIALLIINFLNVIRKLRHIVYCNVRVLFLHVLLYTSHSTLLGYHVTSCVLQQGPMLVILCQLDFQLQVQSVPITTNAMSSNPAHGKVYSIQLYMIHFCNDMRQDDDFLRVLWFLQAIKLTDMIKLKYY